MTNNAETRAALVVLIADLQDAIDRATASGGDDAVRDVVLRPSTGPGRNLGSLEQARALLAALGDYLAELRRQDRQ
jgi:hypothetical protein